MIGIHIEAGFCNRLFKMVFGYVFSKKYGIPFRFEGWERHSHHTTQVYEWLVSRFMETSLYHKDPITYKAVWNEPSDRFIDYIDFEKERTLVTNGGTSPEKGLLHVATTEPVLMLGFFQNERYIKEYRKDILVLLREPEYITERIAVEKEKYEALQSSYFLHIRLGDYLSMEKHFVDLSAYYETCIRDIAARDPGATIVLFSNQPQLIHKVYPNVYQLLKDQELSYRVVDETDEIVGFYLMVRCAKGGICSNSTYGWWASWLNTNEAKKVYMPSQWINMDVVGNPYPDYATVVKV